MYSGMKRSQCFQMKKTLADAENTCVSLTTCNTHIAYNSSTFGFDNMYL